MRIMVSGGFDPIHIGHVRYLKDAENLFSSNQDKLIVLVNDDAWLQRKKGKAFMPEDDRAEIIRSIVPHAYVHIWRSNLDDVSEAIKIFMPNIFAKGGDRTLANLPQAELDACHQINCQIIVGVGGGKIRSSSELLQAYGA